MTVQRPEFPHDAFPRRRRQTGLYGPAGNCASPTWGRIGKNLRCVSTNCAKTDAVSAAPRPRRLQQPAPGGATAKLRSWAGHDGPVIADPFRDAQARIVDAPVSRLPVQQASSLEAALPAMTDQGDGLFGAGKGVECPQPHADIVVSVRVEEGQQRAIFDRAGLAPLLQHSDVDDRCAGCLQALESGAVGMDDFGAKRRSKNVQRAAQGERPQHGSFLAGLIPSGWMFGPRLRRAAGAARSLAFGPQSRTLRPVGMSRCHARGGDAEHGESGKCGEDVANAAVVHGLAPFGSVHASRCRGTPVRRQQCMWVRCRTAANTVLLRSR